MVDKNIELISGDSLTMGFRVSSVNGPMDLTLPDTRIYAQIADLSGRRVLARFQVRPVDMATGQFEIFLPSSVSSGLRGKNLWAVRLEQGERTITIAGGQFIVKTGA